MVLGVWESFQDPSLVWRRGSRCSLRVCRTGTVYRPMMFKVVAVVPSIAIVTEVRMIQETFEGITYVVMVPLFDETYDLV